MGKTCRGVRAKWNEEEMQEALRLIEEGKSQRYVAHHRRIPRRTLRSNVKSGKFSRSLGRPPILTRQLEDELETKIIRFAERGFPLTPKVLRRSAYSFVEKQKIPNKFNQEKKVAGREWYRSFMKHHPNLSRRKAQNMNPARAQKLNKPIVEDYFKKLEVLFEKTGLKNNPQRCITWTKRAVDLLCITSKMLLQRKEQKEFI
ncbi:hypothetical protein CBL_02946 [Carabus blaptoides fortunei]